MASSAPRFAEWYSLDQVRGLESALGDPAPVRQLREQAFERFRELPMEPNPLYRGYGYFAGVDLSHVEPTLRGSAVPLPAPIPGAVRIVHDASGTRTDLPAELAAAGVRVETLSELWSHGDGRLEAFLKGTGSAADRLSALATTLLNRGYRLEVPNGYRAPIRVQELTVLSQPHEAISVRRSLRAGEDSQLLASEEVYSTSEVFDGQRLYASSTDLDLADRAKAVVLSVHAPDLKAVSVYRRAASTGADSRIAWLWNGLGGFRTRVRNLTTMVGRGSAMDDLQTFYGAKNQSYDSSVDVTHVGTDTHAQSITRGVFTDEARGMSRGLVRIEPNARKTVAYVSEHAMLLSRGARSDTIPILEILCRDVKATHSTSVAPVDPEKVFYLESRGMPKYESIRMIGEGFLAYVHERAPVSGLREILYPMLTRRWEGQEITWSAEAYPTLPALTVAGTDAAPEWRFDTKLR